MSNQQPPFSPGLMPGLMNLSATQGVASGRAGTGLRDQTDEMISAIEQNIYKDHSKMTAEDVEAELRGKRVTSRKEPTFPIKLHKLLADPEAEGVIAWLPHGRAWKILDQKKLEILLERYYEHRNITSFMRQVNGWNFHRVPKGKDAHSYYHELFLRGLPHLCKFMVRAKKAKKKDGPLCSSKLLTITPNFYSMDALPLSVGLDGAALAGSMSIPAPDKDEHEDQSGTKANVSSGAAGSDNKDEKEGNKSSTRTEALAPATGGIPPNVPPEMLQQFAAQMQNMAGDFFNTMRMMGFQPNMMLPPFSGVMPSGVANGAVAPAPAAATNVTENDSAAPSTGGAPANPVVAAGTSTEQRQENRQGAEDNSSQEV